VALHAVTEGVGGTTTHRTIKRQAETSHKVLSRDGWQDYVYAFHDNEEIGPRMLARIARRTGLAPKDLK